MSTPGSASAPPQQSASGGWDDVVATALVGTERRALPPEVRAGLAGLLEAQPAGGPEEQVLTAAAVLAARRRAGWTPPTEPLPVPPSAPPDGRPVAPPKVLQVLDLLLDEHVPVSGHPLTLVVELLDRCAASGRRLPPATLPRLIAAATAAPRVRRAALRAGGPPLRWLAGRNLAWAWALDDERTDHATVWTTGTRDERLAVLTALRRTDPARALELLTGTWDTEPASDRGRFLDALRTGLSPGDEPFLEAALDDRARGVRALAAELLASLPTSALATRMRERVRPLVTAAGRRLEVALPAGADAAAQRDGIRPFGAPDGVGPSGWLLQQLVAAAPLRFWEEHLDAGPEEAVALAVGHAELLAGWAEAAVRQRDPAWARALLARRPQPALLRVLPPPAAHADVVALLERVRDPALHGLLGAVPAPWPQATSTAVLRRVRTVAKPQDLLPLLPVLAAGLDPAAAPDVAAWAGDPPADERRREHLHLLASTLSIRATIAQELA